MVLEYIVAATIVVSLMSLVGTLVFFVAGRFLDKVLFASVSFATGALLGAAFFDLLPEAFEQIDVAVGLQLVFLGILAFFILEKFFWHHHHESHQHSEKKIRRSSKEKPIGYLALAGSLVHNFFDGVAIAAAFLVNIPLGFATTLAIVLHEIPHEMGDVGLLLYSGFSLKKATLYNLVTGLTSVFGGVLFYSFAPPVGPWQSFALAFTAGTFIYIATADLVPELHKEHNIQASILQLGLVLLGAGVIWATHLLFSA